MRKLIEKKRRDFRRLTKNGVSILCLMMMLVLLASAVFAVAEENASTSAPASDGAGVTTQTSSGSKPAATQNQLIRAAFESVVQSGSDSVPSETKQTEVGNEDSDVPGDTGALEDETENGASGEGVLTGIDDGNGETPNGNEGDETPSGETSGGSDDDKHSDKAPDVDEDDRLVEVLIPDNGNDDSSEGKTEVSNIENGDDNSGALPAMGMMIRLRKF